MNYNRGDVIIILYNDNLGYLISGMMGKICSYYMRIEDEDFFWIDTNEESDFGQFTCPESMMRLATEREKFLYQLYGSNALINNEECKC